MRLFASSAGRSAVSSGGQSREQFDSLRGSVPARFEALGEALAAGTAVEEAGSVIGRDLARDGTDLASALGGLQRTYAFVAGREPDFAATHSLCLAWSEETLAYLHQLSCEDPLTGLAGLAHLRTRLTEIYRGVEQQGGSITTSHALVVIDLPSSAAEDHFAHALRVVKSVETIRLVFPGSETISQIAGNRLGVVSERTNVLGRQVKALRSLLDAVDREGSTVRVWIEGLPSTDPAAGMLLDELART